MKYKLTEQYARGEEMLFAEFQELLDVNIFMAKKSHQDDEQGHELIYRLYDDSELLREFNKKNISVGYAQFAESNGDLTNQARSFFNVLIKPVYSSERTPIANFYDEHDASLFITNKCNIDETIHDNDLFLVFKNNVLYTTSSRILLSNQKKEYAGSTEGRKGAVFRPTPMPMRPIPPGFPSDHWDEENEEND
ncbi:MAG: hypothetical protein Q8R24_00380 [Legionellaceae bacterium]|nr:hypothetical protein [Legionellaceae bacterium]